MVKSPPTSAEDFRGVGWTLGREDALEEGMANHSSVLAWRIPWTEDPGGLRAIGSQRVGVNAGASPAHVTYLRERSVCCERRVCSALRWNVL